MVVCLYVLVVVFRMCRLPGTKDGRTITIDSEATTRRRRIRERQAGIISNQEERYYLSGTYIFEASFHEPKGQCMPHLLHTSLLFPSHTSYSINLVWRSRAPPADGRSDRSGVVRVTACGNESICKESQTPYSAMQCTDWSYLGHVRARRPAWVHGSPNSAFLHRR